MHRRNDSDLSGAKRGCVHEDCVQMMVSWLTFVQDVRLLVVDGQCPLLTLHKPSPWD